MTAFRVWLAARLVGRKTYLLAGVLLLGVIGLVFAGRLTPSTASEIFLVAMSGFAITFRSALSAHQAQELHLLREVAQLGMLYRADDPAFKASLLSTAKDVASVAMEMHTRGRRAGRDGEPMFVAVKSMLDEESRGLLGKIALGTGLTGGGVAVYELFEFLKSNPVLAVGLIRSFGAEFVIAITLIVLLNRLIGVMEKSAASNQDMADAIRQIADKDDRQAERMTLLNQYTAQTSQEVSAAMTELLKRSSLQDSALDRIEKGQAAIRASQPLVTEKGT